MLNADQHFSIFRMPYASSNIPYVIFYSSSHPGPLYLLWWPWELLWRKIVWHILFSNEHYNYESKMFSDINNTCAVTQLSLYCYVTMLWFYSWNHYRWWRHHPFMTSLRHMTQFNLIWFNLPFSMVLPSFITNQAILSSYGPTPWSREFLNSRFQGHNTK